MFDKLYNELFMAESVLDYQRKDLDPNVFDFPESGNPILKPAIKKQIINNLEKIHSIVPLMDCYIVGSILTKKYNNFSDIDVTCEADSEPNNIAVEALSSLLSNINGEMAIGTTHPINYYIVEGQFDKDRYNAIYDVLNDIWIKEDDGQYFNAKKYMTKLENEFKHIDLATAELRRDLIDYKLLKELSKDEINNFDYEVHKHLAEIESDIKKIVDMYDRAKIIRKRAFVKDMSPKEIREFGHKNNLPENILYKMLERYYYKELATKLKDIIEPDEKVEKSDVPKIKKALNNFLKNA